MCVCDDDVPYVESGCRLVLFEMPFFLCAFFCVYGGVGAFFFKKKDIILFILGSADKEAAKSMTPKRLKVNGMTFIRHGLGDFILFSSFQNIATY